MTIQNSNYGIKASTSESVNLNNIIFKDNDYTLYVNDNSGYTVIDSSSFTNNNFGPYINENDSLLIKNSTINDNSIRGLSISETIADIKNSTFHGNNRAIQFHSQTNDSLELVNVVLDSNSYYGLSVGSSNNEQIKVNISNSTFSNNSTSPSYDQGSAIWSKKNTLKVTNTKFLSNYSHSKASIYIEEEGANVTFTGCIFSKNDTYTQVHGSVFSTKSDLSITDCIFLNNERNVFSGSDPNTAAANISILNSIIWGNGIIMNSWPNINIAVTYSCIEGGYTGTGNISQDPNFCNPFDSNLTLPQSSPCTGTGWYNENMGGLAIGCSEPLTTFYIDDDGQNNGVGTINNPLVSISNSITNLSSGDTVIVYPGTYEGDIDFNDKSIVLASRILELGDTTYVDSTIIEGIVTIGNAVDSTALFKGFTITGDFTDRGLNIHSDNNVMIEHIKVLGVGGVHVDNAIVRLYDITIKHNSTNQQGGGIKIATSAANLFNVKIDSNSSTSNFGGGAYIQRSTVNMNGVEITNNTSSSSGGGIYLQGSNTDSSIVTIHASSITGNNAGSEGGGLFVNEYSIMNITESSIANNISYSYGGGIHNQGVLRVHQTQIKDNLNTYNSGGGLYSSGPFSLYDSHILGNETSQSRGGGIYSTGGNNATLPDTIINCIISNNHSIGGGGGMSIEDYSTFYMVNTLIANNTTGEEESYDYGGGIYSYLNTAGDIDPKMINCTVANNQVIGSGSNGGIYTQGQSLTQEMYNTIVWHNDPPLSLGGSPSHSNIEGQSNTLDTDPLFVDMNAGDYRLSNYSPSIGTGTLEGAPDTDLDGNPRPQPVDTNPDMGAYENALGERLTGATYYVASAGSDSSNGQLSTPFRTIQHGVNAAWDGDTVIVYPGTYAGNVDFNNKSIVLASRILESGDTTYIDSTIIEGVVLINADVDSTALFSGFTITGDFTSRGLIISSDYNVMIEHIKVLGVGGVEVINAVTTMHDVVVKQNTYNTNGGGINIVNSTVELVNTFIDSNTKIM